MKSLCTFATIAITSAIATASPTWDFTSGFTQVYASNGSTDTWYAGESWGSIYASDPGSSESQASISDSSIHWSADSNLGQGGSWNTNLTFTVSENATLEIFLQGGAYVWPTGHLEVLNGSGGTMYEFQENGTGWYPADEPIIERYLNLQAGETYTITTELSAVSGSMDGRFSIFTPVPAPAALALFGLVGITRKRRRT